MSILQLIIPVFCLSFGLGFTLATSLMVRDRNRAKNKNDIVE